MQLSLHADYSCRVLMYLAVHQSEAKSSIDEISKAYGISTNHLVKVVHNLGKLGFVDTMRGRGGGLRLSRSAKDILIGDVIRRTEPSFALVECFKGDVNTCPIIGPCGLKPILGKAVAAFLSVLDEVTLADVTVNRKRLADSLGLMEAR